MSSTVGAPGVFIVPLQSEFGWSTAEISSALSIRFMLFGLMAPFAAALMNRFGLRPVTLTALLIVASGLVASLAMREIWQLVLLWGVAVGLGTGMTALVLGATIATRWFVARRGMVLGILVGYVLNTSYPKGDETLAHIPHVIYGAMIMLFLIVEPMGLGKLYSNVRNYLMLWPFGYSRK